MEEPSFAAPDARLLRRVRWRLAAWSGGATLLTLFVLGAALYLGLTAALAAAGEERIRDQADALELIIANADDEAVEHLLEGRPEEGGELGSAMFGGPSADMVSILVSPQGRVVGDVDADVAASLPVGSSVTASRAEGADLREAELGHVPVRVLSRSVSIVGEDWVLQVIQDRRNEQRVLSTTIGVLGIGGVAVLAASIGIGFLYAGRALVPIRDSLRRQREFAADASHELRTPIAVVKGSIEDMRRHPDQRVADVGSALADMEAETDRLTQLVDDLLLLARADSGTTTIRRHAIDLADAADAALRTLAHRAKAAGIELRLEASPAPVIGDADRLRQLIAIVVDNALRHGPPGSVVTVAVERDSRHAVATVQDEGPGIRADDLPRLFDRFWRAADAAYEGSGLGLAIARWIADAHGGSITASSSSGGGARFEIRVPLRGA